MYQQCTHTTATNKRIELACHGVWPGVAGCGEVGRRRKLPRDAHAVPFCLYVVFLVLDTTRDRNIVKVLCITETKEINIVTINTEKKKKTVHLQRL